MLRIRPLFRYRILFTAMSVALAACSQTPHKAEPAKPATAAVASNPFFAASTLQYQAPPFDRIKDSDYQPAIEEGIKQHLVEIDKIATQTATPTFDNTIVAMERSGALYTRVTHVFDAIAQSNTNDTLQKVQEDEAPKRAAHDDEIFLNGKLFAHVKAIYDARASLDAESKFLTERYYLKFVRAGASTQRGR